MHSRLTGRTRAIGLGVLAGLVLAAAAGDARAQGQALKPKLTPEQIAVELQKGGYNILLRHTSTEDVVPDPDHFDLADCRTQRNLSEEGRREAKLMGRAFQKLGVRLSSVHSSPYCRCVETGELAFGQVEKLDLLSVGDDLSAAEKDARGAEIRALLAAAPPEGANTVLITHTGSLLYSFGLQVTPEGIAHVFRPSEYGPAVYVGMVLPDQWPAIAGMAAGPPSSEAAQAP